MRQMIDDATTPGEIRYDWLEEDAKDWKGLETLEGVAAIYDLSMKTENGYERIACFRLMQLLKVPHDQIADYLIGEAKECGDDTYLLMVYMVDLQRYMMVSEAVPAFYAELLNDKRKQSRNPKASEHDITRVCDVAVNSLIKWLQEKKLFDWNEKSDLIYDTYRDDQYDHNIRAIRPYLVKAGVMDADGNVRLDKSHAAKVQETTGQGALRPMLRPESAEGSKQHPDTVGRWWLISAWITLGLAIAAWIKTRRSRKTTDFRS